MSAGGEFPAAANVEPNAFDAAFARLQRHSFSVNAADGRPVELHSELGSGRTKIVYDAHIGDEHWAIGFPHPWHTTQEARTDWQEALREPAATDYLRSGGFLVNDCCRLLPVTVDNIPFPAIGFTPYADLPFDVLDGKNPHSSSVSRGFFTEPVDETGLRALMRGVQNDIGLAVAGGVRLKMDSLNIGRQKGVTRLYLNDLAETTIRPISPAERLKIAGDYIAYSISALMVGGGEYRYRRYLSKLARTPDIRRYGRIERSLAQEVVDAL
jgi:hypothetical protein